jgi:hypothetical protein
MNVFTGVEFAQSENTPYLSQHGGCPSTQEGMLHTKTEMEGAECSVGSIEMLKDLGRG